MGAFTHGGLIFRNRAGQFALFGGQETAGGGQTRLGQGDIGARHLAHIEPVLRGAQFLGDQPDVRFAQRHEFRRAADVHIGLHDAQQHLLFGPQQALAGGQHDFLLRFDRQFPPATVPQDQFAQDRQLGRNLILKQTGRALRTDAQLPVHDGPQGRDGLSHILVRRAQQGAVLFQQAGIFIGCRQRIGQRIGPRAQRRDQYQSPKDQGLQPATPHHLTVLFCRPTVGLIHADRW
jgi:hypothetical protein